MNWKKYTTRKNLDEYSFLWSEARLVIAALSLLIGGTPIIFVLGYNSVFTSLLNLSWIISGIASVYLLYRWNLSHKKVFGKKDLKDMIAFFVSVVSGINLGIAGLLTNNIGMSISSNRFVFVIVAALYVWAAVHLFLRWKESEKKIF